MSKKIISAILSLSLILSFFTFALAEDNPGITAYEGNVYTVGVSQIFFFENIFPTEVYVNNELISDYDISSKMRKLYIHGSIFDNAGTYSVMISDGDIEAVTDITVSDNTEVYEYSIDGTYDKGSLINPSSTAGAEHSALGSQGGRKPIIVRTITSSQIPNLWVRWDITNTGRFSIDYWCPKYYVCCPVTVTVQDKNGVHTFENLLAEEQTAKYVTLSEDGTNPYIFDFTGNGEYYLQVSPFQAKVNFIVDSFKMYGFAAEHNLESPYVTSDVYSIDGDTINGVLFHTAENDIIKNIDIPADCVYELESDGEFINMGDSFIVKKIFDESICNIYSFGKVLYISSQKYTIDDINSEILQIPYGETYEDFMSGIVHNELVTIKIFDGDSEKTDGCISDTDVLQIYVNNALKETFKLSVIPPSNENTIFSELYEITDNTINIPYGECISDIVSNITLSPYAVLSHPYEADTSKKVTKSFKLTVTAQNGDKREYTASIIIGSSDTSDISSEVYNVENNIIAPVADGTSIDKFLAQISASNGGSIKIYDKNMAEKTSGNIENGDTVRVFPRYRYAGNEYNTYSIQMIPEYRTNADPEIIWSCANNEKNSADNLSFICTDFRDGSGFSRIRKGYGDIPADAAKNICFNYTAVEDGVVNVDYFATTDTEGVLWEYNIKILKNNQAIEEKNVKISESALVDLGNYELNAGDVLTITPNCITGTNTFISAVLFTRMASYSALITNIETDNEDYCSFDISFNFDVDDTSIPNGLRIISENGNIMPYSFTAASAGYHIITEYPVEAGVRYFIEADKISAVNGEMMSYTAIVPISPVPDKVRVTVRLEEGLETINTDISIKSDISEDITVYCIQYKNNNIVKIDSFPYSIVKDIDFSSTETTEAENGVDRLSILAVGSDGRLLTNTYYAD